MPGPKSFVRPAPGNPAEKPLHTGRFTAAAVSFGSRIVVGDRPLQQGESDAGAKGGRSAIRLSRHVTLAAAAGAGVVESWRRLRSRSHHSTTPILHRLAAPGGPGPYRTPLVSSGFSVPDSIGIGSRRRLCPVHAPKDKADQAAGDSHTGEDLVDHRVTLLIPGEYGPQAAQP